MSDVITGRGFYKQRNGSKAEILGIGRDGAVGFAGGSDGGVVFEWNARTGRFGKGFFATDSEFDIIGPWISEPPPKPIPEPKFNVGDRVMVITKDYGSWFGLRGSVLNVRWNDTEWWIRVETPERGTGLFSENELELLPNPQEWTPTNERITFQKFTNGTDSEWRVV